ncbi:class II aldolase/adducin family protein [Roseomonas sp. BN140053]|uniref:class II aldolase/adducin family protein n=1 Tax=Roseomonas sp. BN140053 TaxID=3391898 RepID=UPI0039E82EFD
MDQQLYAALGELVIANRILAHEGVLDDFGHISLRHPGRPDRFFVSCSRSPELVDRDDLIEFDLDCKPVELNGRRPYLESVLHARVFAARPEVQSCVHHHAPSVLPFTVASTPLRPVFHMAAVLGSEVPVWDSRTEFGDTNMLIDDIPKADSHARALGSGSAVLLRHHGASCVGTSLAAAVFVSVRMRDNAELQSRAVALGGASFLTPGEIEQTGAMLLSERPLARAWQYWRARAGYSGI